MKRILAAAALTCLAAGTSTPAFADGPYGPVPTGPSGAPGGYTNVVAAKTIGIGGGTLHVHAAGGRDTVLVPKGAFRHPMELEITAPNLQRLDKALRKTSLRHYEALAGLGIAVVKADGSAYRGSFVKALRVSIHAAHISGKSRVVEFTGPKSHKTVRAATRKQEAILKLNRDPDIAVLRHR